MLRSFQRSIVRTAVTGTVIVATVEWTTHLPSQGRSSLFYHSLADNVVTPLLRRFLDPEQAHAAAIALADYAPIYRPSVVEQSVNLQTTVWGITFSNPIGLAAGFDKDAQVPFQLLQMGFGSVEVGTVTPLPQPGNEKPRMYRLLPDKGIINRYGFNSQGMHVVADNLKQFRKRASLPIQHEQEDQVSSSQQPLHKVIYVTTMIAKSCLHLWQLLFPGPSYHAPLIVGVNLGRNKDSDSAQQDYLLGIQTLGQYADYLVINISSPNTPGLRDLQTQPETLSTLLETCILARDFHAPKSPLLLKLAPDLTTQELIDIAHIVSSKGIDGLIVCNTTNARPSSLQSPHQSESGGLSGMPLKDRATECIHILYKATNGTIPIIGVGGISDARDVMAKLKAGASLVQVYSVLAYEGPGVVSRIRHDLALLMKQEGFKAVADIVGHDHEEIHWKQQQAAALKNAIVEPLFVEDKEDEGTDTTSSNDGDGVAANYDDEPVLVEE